MFTTAHQPTSEVNWVIEWRSEEVVVVVPGTAQIFGAVFGAILAVFALLALGVLIMTKIKRGEAFSLYISSYK